MEEFNDCAKGWHATLVEGQSVYHEQTINVSLACPRCGAIVMEDSYTLDAWNRRQGKRKGTTDGDPRLPF